MLEQERQRAAQPIRPMGGVRSSSAANGSARARFAPATHDTPVLFSFLVSRSSTLDSDDVAALFAR